MKVSNMILIMFSCILYSAIHGEEDFSSQNETRDARIVGGTIAQTKYRKGVALIYSEDWLYYYGPSCTGSIIGRKWILSAAHCFEDKSGFIGGAGISYGVIPSSWYADLRAAHIRGITVKNVYVHKEYKGKNMHFDIAILELKKEIPWEFYNKVEIVDVPADYTKVKAVGYGNINDNPPDGTPAKYCMMTEVLYRKFDWCTANSNNPAARSRSNQLCAVSLITPQGITE